MGSPKLSSRLANGHLARTQPDMSACTTSSPAPAAQSLHALQPSVITSPQPVIAPSEVPVPWQIITDERILAYN